MDTPDISVRWVTELDIRGPYPRSASLSCTPSGKLAFLICVSGVMKVLASERRYEAYGNQGVEASCNGPRESTGTGHYNFLLIKTSHLHYWSPVLLPVPKNERACPAEFWDFSRLSPHCPDHAPALLHQSLALG